MTLELEKEREIENQHDSDSPSSPDVPLNSAQEPQPEEHVLGPRPESGSTAVAEAPPDEHVYITGWKLLSVMATVTLSTFTILLDQSIIATVRK